MLWLVTCLKVEMHKGALHFIKVFDTELQRLSNIMRLVQGHVLRQYHVDLNDETLCETESTNCVDLLDIYRRETKSVATAESHALLSWFQQRYVTVERNSGGAA